MYDSGNTTRSARLFAASRIKDTVFCTVLAVSRKTGATLQAEYSDQSSRFRQSRSGQQYLPATRTFGSQEAMLLREGSTVPPLLFCSDASTAAGQGFSGELGI